MRNDPGNRLTGIAAIEPAIEVVQKGDSVDPHECRRRRELAFPQTGHRLRSRVVGGGGVPAAFGERGHDPRRPHATLLVAGAGAAHASRLIVRMGQHGQQAQGARLRLLGLLRQGREYRQEWSVVRASARPSANPCATRAAGQRRCWLAGPVLDCPRLVHHSPRSLECQPGSALPTADPPATGWGTSSHRPVVAPV